MLPAKSGDDEATRMWPEEMYFRQQWATYQKVQLLCPYHNKPRAVPCKHGCAICVLPCCATGDVATTSAVACVSQVANEVWLHVNKISWTIFKSKTVKAHALQY